MIELRQNPGSDEQGIRQPHGDDGPPAEPPRGREAITPGRRTRVRKTPISTKSVLCEAYDYPKKVSFSRGMRVELGDYVMLFVSGTASINENGRSVHPGDVRAQTARTLGNIRALLQSEGADWHDVVRTTCYLADFRTYDEFNEVRNAFYEAEGLNPFPASTCIEARICRPELLVEVEAIAIVPKTKSA
jgi:2-iminobutanoate/2-iminopropanoate deaminase